MRVLALDTALQACSAAVLVAGEGRARLVRESRLMERGHAESLIPMVEAVMAEAGIAYGDLDRIAVTTGPGTFTGSRIGVATARGLALAAAVPLVGATTLAVMARQVRNMAPVPMTAPLAIAVDARRGQLYVAVYDAQGRERAAPAVLPPEEAARLLTGPAVAAGSGARMLAEAAAQVPLRVEAIHPDLQPDAGALAELALDLVPDGRPVSPLYLRPPDATPLPPAVNRQDTR